MQSYISRKAQLNSSAIHGMGLLARDNIDHGEVVAVKGGHIYNFSMLRLIEDQIQDSYIQIGLDLYIGALNEQEVETNKLFLNHSCQPNLGILGQISFVALRDIEAGEELTYDWAMENDEGPAGWRLVCTCGQRNCRGVLTGSDWRLPELQERYRGFFSSYLQKKIDDGMDR